MMNEEMETKIGPTEEQKEQASKPESAAKKAAAKRKARAVLADLGVTIGYANGKGYLSASRSLSDDEAKAARKAYRTLNA